VIIAIDKPFIIGDYIRIGAIEGTVEDVGFRVIKLRLSDKTMVTIPNSLVTAEKVENVSRRDRQKVVVSIVISNRNDHDTIVKALDKLRLIIKEKELVHQDTSHVNFTDFKDSNPVITIVYYLEITDELQFQENRNDVNMQIFKTLREMNIDMNIGNKQTNL
jgi:MscS family membrane protein